MIVQAALVAIERGMRAAMVLAQARNDLWCSSDSSWRDSAVSVMASR